MKKQESDTIPSVLYASYNHSLKDYHIDSLMDEINAYIMFNSRKLEKKGIDMRPYDKLKKQLIELYYNTCNTMEKI